MVDHTDPCAAISRPCLLPLTALPTCITSIVRCFLVLTTVFPPLRISVHVKCTDHSHTADIQLHGHGATLGLALASVGVCMNNYMVELHSVGIDVDCTLHTTLRDTDLHRLTYRYLDSLLGYFLDDFIIFREIVMDVVYSSTTSMFTATCVLYGEKFQMGKHVRGTEIKAITYSHMQIDGPRDDGGGYDIYVITDI
uniref:Protein archease-like n=1 Tax=Lygus hesperus TaxID=30085 RepID=A0A146LAN3_LYGHE